VLLPNSVSPYSSTWQGEEVFIGEAFAGELIGLAEHESGDHIARFCHRDLGVIDRDRLCSAACAAPRRSGNGGDTASVRG